MTMRVLQIQLRSLTAMDIVAYGGAAAGIGVALWQYAHTTAAAAGASAAGWSPIMLAAHLPGAFAYLAYGLQYLMPFGAGFPLTLAGLLLIVLLSAEFFIPMRQLGSYFHVAMNDMTSTKRIFALLDTPEPAHGTATLPATTGTDVGTDTGTKAGTEADGGITVSFDHVGYSYDSADSGAAVQQMNSAPAPALTGLTFTAYPRSTHRHQRHLRFRQIHGCRVACRHADRIPRIAYAERRQGIRPVRRDARPNHHPDRCQ